MSEHTFPESEESPEQRTARAVDALEREESLRLGFRRRSFGEQSGNPYGKPEQFQVQQEESAGMVLGGILGGFSLVIGAGALVYKPLLLGFIAVVLGIGAVAAGGRSAQLGRHALVVATTCTIIGILLSIWMERPVV